MAARPSPLLLLGLGAAALLWLASRTERGSAVVGKITTAAGEAAAVVRDLFAPRGIRNHNPGNIRRTGTTWKGQSLEQGDAAFVQFDAPEWGLRALARILRGDMREGDTLRRIINEWAPPSENDTGAYVNAVASSLGVHPDSQVSDAQLPLLMQAIVQHENGQQPYGPDMYARAIELERSA